jgi:hypothetical protein
VVQRVGVIQRLTVRKSLAKIHSLQASTPCTISGDFRRARTAGENRPRISL